MSQSPEFYAARIAECSADANSATLANVRDRALRAKASWQTLATQARAVRDRRDILEAGKAAERAAALEA